MKHIIAFVVKYVMVTVILEIILGIFTNLSIAEILTVALTVTVVTYLFGDLLILSLFNNTIAAVSDAGLSWLIIYLFNYPWPIRNIPLLSALSAAVIIGIGEVFFHMYMEKNILHQTPRDRDASIIR